MHVVSTLLPVVALLDLPEEAQQVIARHPDVRFRRTLATSPYASPSTIDRCVSDSDRDTHHAALRRTTDVDMINERLRRSTTCCTTSIMRNPNTPHESLIEALTSSTNSIRLAAYVNAATPVESRRTLTADQVTELVDVGEPLGSTVVRSHEALITNPELFDHLEQFGQVLRRAAFAMPQLSVEQYRALRKTGSSRYANRHPVFSRGTDWEQSATLEDLLALRSPAADLWIAEHPSTDEYTARDMFLRKDHHVEPHVIARLLTRYGTSIIPGTKRDRIAQTRVDSAAWSNPLATTFNDVVDAKTTRIYDALVEGVATLSGDPAQWESLLTLSSHWDGTIVELFASARAL
jgi:hypothetical protein